MHPTNLRDVQLTRGDLFAAIWEKPADKLAAEFGISGRGLAKICEGQGIPVPPRGYWARVHAGHRVRRPKLPGDPSGPVVFSARSEFEIEHRRATSAGAIDPEIRALLERVEGADPPAAGQAVGRHTAVVRRIAKDLKDEWRRQPAATYDDRDAELAPDVSTENAERALRLLDSIVRELSRHRVHVTAIEGGRVVGIRGVVVGETFSVRVRERLHRVRRPVLWMGEERTRLVFVKSDTLSIQIDLQGATGSRRWSDGRTPLEERVGQVLPMALRWIDRCRHERAVIDKFWHDHELEEQRRAEDEQRKRDERARRSRLLREASRWRRADTALAYLAEVERRLLAQGPVDAASGAAQWIAWARTAIERSNPLLSRVVDLQAVTKAPPRDAESAT
jgi:hypothetical protein